MQCGLGLFPAKQSVTLRQEGFASHRAVTLQSPVSNVSLEGEFVEETVSM